MRELMSGPRWKHSVKKRLTLMSKRGRYAQRETVDAIKKAMRGEAGPGQVMRLVDRGVVVWRDGHGVPRLTPVGTALVMSESLGVAFVDLCVLAVVYRYTWKQTARPGEFPLIPTRTIQRVLEDWPYHESQVGKSLSYLRAVGLLPRCRPKLVECNVKHLAGIHDKLLTIDRWVVETSCQIRSMLVVPDADSS